MPVSVQSTTHVDMAVDFYNSSQTTLWIGIGNPTNGWQSPYSDTSPPTPATNLTALDNPIGYKQVDTVSLIYPSASGTITYQGQQWATATPATAHANGAFYVYVSGSINYSELPTGVYYREIGIFNNLVLNSGVTGPAVTPSQVSSVGELLLVEYTGPTLRQSDQQEVINYIIQF